MFFEKNFGKFIAKFILIGFEVGGARQGCLLTFLAFRDRSGEGKF